MNSRGLFGWLLMAALVASAAAATGCKDKDPAGTPDVGAGGSPAGRGGSGTGGSGGVGGSGGSSGAGGTVAGTGRGGAGGTSGSGGAGGSGGNAGNAGGPGGTGGATGGTTGGAGTGGQAGTGGSGGGGAGGSAACPMDCSVRGLVCCGGKCVNTGNDILNCGGCGSPCTGANPYCDNGRCGTARCTPGTTCTPQSSCCGTQCCSAGTICCVVPGGPTANPMCVTPDNGSCPAGCPSCPCASPDTPIATPSGDRPIARLVPGDLVYSFERGRKVVVPVKAINRTPVTGHMVLQIRLDSGAILEISGKHPTADGRTLAAVLPGQLLGGMKVQSVRLVPYRHPFTHDILPDSESGAYYAGGALIGSTLKP
jgi:hypothetical protein